MNRYSDKLLINAIILLVWSVVCVASFFFFKKFLLIAGFVEVVLAIINVVLICKATDWQSKIDYVNYSHID